MTDWPNHDAAWAEWREAVTSERMHHGWILAGKAGLGKRDFAITAARELVSEDGIPQPAGDHPDILVLTHLPKDKTEEKKRDDGKPYEVKRNIAVDQIRMMQQRLTTRPTLGSKRVIIIDPADDMERPASNALLKSLEEPPRGTYFLLVTHRPAGLLPTIRSRCRILRFQTMSGAEIADHLNVDGELAQSAIALSGGSLGNARAFLEMELAPVAKVMQQLVAGGDPRLSLRADFIRAVGTRPSRETIQAVLELARSTLAQTLTDASREQRGAIIDAHTSLVELTAKAPTYNFDNGLLLGEIASLLGSAGAASEPIHG